MTGDVSLSTVIGPAAESIGDSTETAVVTKTDDGKTHTTVSTDDATFTPTGGSITADNAKGAEIDGVFTANAATDATVTNEGLLKNHVAIAASDNSTVTSTASTTAATVFTDAPTPVVVTDPATPPNTTTKTSDSFADTESKTSATSTTTTTSTGGNASFANSADGVVGVKASLVDVDVTGDTSSTASNAGEIFGNVSVDSEQSTEVTTSGSSSDGASTTTVHDVVVQTDDGTNPVFSSSQSLKSVVTTVSTQTTSSGNSTDVTGGAASLTNSGDIAGFASVEDATSASFDNSGSVEGNIFLLADADSGNTTTVQQDNSGAPGISTTVTTDTEVTQNFDGSDAFVNLSQEIDKVGSFLDKTGGSESTTGGTAVLTNEKAGIFGVKGTPVTVSVRGQASATATNAGTIFGSINIVAVEGSETGTTTASGTTESDITNTGTFLGAGGGQKTVGGVIVETFGTTQDHETGTQDSAASSTTLLTGGVSLLTNSGAISGDVTVGGDSLTSSFDNSGSVGGAVSVQANQFPTDTTSTDISDSFDDLSGQTIDQTTDVTKGVTTITTATTANENDTGTQTELVSELESAPVGDALLTNEAGGTIGDTAAPVALLVSGGTSSTLNNDGTIFALDAWPCSSSAPSVPRWTTSLPRRRAGTTSFPNST